MSHDDERFFIGELADRTGVSRDTIRYYERLGVLPEAPRARSGYRLYDAAAVDRMRFVAQAQTLGLTLDEIGEVLGLVDQGREPCVHVRDRLRARLEETRERIRELRALEHRLDDALTTADAAGRDAADTCRCRIIESAGAGPS